MVYEYRGFYCTEITSGRRRGWVRCEYTFRGQPRNWVFSSIAQWAEWVDYKQKFINWENYHK